MDGQIEKQTNGQKFKKIEKWKTNSNQKLLFRLRLDVDLFPNATFVQVRDDQAESQTVRQTDRQTDRYTERDELKYQSIIMFTAETRC